ncbi:hypothetical protein FIU97_01180 [Roseivivax sp. THAF40]|uniref:DUF6206 family protein n=1 Tax=unclassified Roseivivax TaxID=2639302 RepID=UPI001269095F|nr:MULTISPECIES: DUF6206 family protein [unclassified Roseivivax]QFS81445.1 hypothetical protein FIV09_01270 [Roseivivax sp. THAF197b]QFT45174.1 hypothetical protein FIU97_01180 [Roseivivax sp. THAF40]
MTDLAALADLIRADTATRGRTISRLGYFCAPFQPPSGPFSDKVIKVYRGSADDAALERMARAHDDYVRVLTECGVTLPETAFHLVDLDGTGSRTPVIVQEALPLDSLMRPRMRDGSREETIAMMQAAGEVIARFWIAAEHVEERVGFHPSIRNFAIRDGKAIFFDTFPPLIHYNRDDMGKLLLQFSEKRLMRLIGPLMQARVTGIQDEWYSPPETLVGLVGSACRLRPEYADDYLDWGRSFAKSHMAQWADEALHGLDGPPQLPGYWTGFRKLLGLQGEPNV